MERDPVVATMPDFMRLAEAFGAETPRGKLCSQLAEALRRREARENETACLDWLDEPDFRIIDEFRLIEVSIMPEGLGVGGHVIKESIR